MMKYFKKYAIRFSLFGLLAFILQELPYIPWLLRPPTNNPLANNAPANLVLGIMEQAGGFMTIALLILIVHKPIARPDFKNKYMKAAILCLIAYYICWICYYAGITNGWLIVIGLSATVPIYYLLVAIWLSNPFAITTSIIFLIGHTVSNAINFLVK